jgi:DNA mismatch endonuclease (patch repair protein)
MTRDVDTTERLTQAGWTVLRYWSHEDPAAVADSIQLTVGQLKAEGL